MFSHSRSFLQHLTTSFVFRLTFSTQLLPPSFRFPSPPFTLRHRPPTFLYSFSSRTLVFPSRTSYRTPRNLRVTRSGPPEKVGSVNCVHVNRARSSPRSSDPPFLTSSSEIDLSSLSHRFCVFSQSLSLHTAFTVPIIPSSHTAHCVLFVNLLAFSFRSSPLPRL